MIRALANEEVERVLRAANVGRIGCHSNGRTYVVPVSYVFQDGAIYAHSAPGQKVDMMRENPNVCFQVDHVEDLVNWTSAICWGTFEELEAEQAQLGLELLRNRLAHDLPRAIEHGRLAAEEANSGETPVVFRINLTEMSGREERMYWQLLPLAPNDPRAELETTFAQVHSTGVPEWSDMIPEDVLAERDAETRGMVMLPAEGGPRD